ncbi:MAG: ABC transporter ATP-binding protein [Anaerolineae bacterium]|nr:ABC transporter ATP-binding protein [Anaerolineae bacterium]
MAYLEIEHIYKTYEAAPLLSDLSLSIERGEIVSLLGPSGSGKTTLLRIIAGLESAEGGRVLLRGRDVAHMPAHKRGIVLMFQEYALFPHRTVAENVAFGLRMQHRPRPKIHARVQEMLGLVGLSGFDDRSVAQLSGGERQRVALARSLAPAPELLLLDEPLGSLDRTLRERLLEDLGEILREVGVTAIAVTHDQTEAFSLADRVAVLHATQIVQVGTPQQIYQNPLTPWVARFLGLTNLFAATRLDEDLVSSPLGRLALAPAGSGASSSAQSGDTGTILVLPWGIEITPDANNTTGDASPSLNAFVATVTHAIFQGRITKVRLHVEGDAVGDTGGTGVALSLAIDMGAELPRVGDRVRGHIKPEALRWFQSSGEVS